MKKKKLFISGFIMLPYSRGIILDNSNNYGIVKTETVFGFGPSNQENYVKESLNSTEPLEWIGWTHGNFERRALSAETESRSLKKKAIKITTPIPQQRNTKKSKSKKKKSGKSNKKRKGKGKKCIYKIIRKSERKKNRRGNKQGNKMGKKYILPMVLGLMAAKSLLIPIALKALAFLSAKGLMMGFFSTVMASVLSLKGMFDHSHGYANRKDDTKTQVEIIQVPTKTEDHVYYDEHYKRGDLVPVHRFETAV